MRKKLKINTEPKWLCLSFVGQPSGHLGTAYVQSGRNPLLRPDIKCWVIKDLPPVPIKEIAMFECPDSEVPQDHKYHNRLLSRAEMEEFQETASIGEMEYRQAQ
jgi:hypothetical protein